jgi:hypothetical protein
MGKNNKSYLAIISCKSGKMDYTCEAKELYSKNVFFREQYAFLEAAYDKILISSAKHHLILPTKVIEPYELSFDERVRVNKVRIIADDGYKKQWGIKVKNQIDKVIDMFDEIHLHLPNSYWKWIKPYFKNNPKVIKISQQINPGENKKRYIEALEYFNKTGEINTFIIEERRKAKNPEVEKWFYGPNEEEFFGYTRGLVKQYPYLDEGTVHKLSKGKIPHHKGWVIDKNLLTKLYQTDKGQWRIKK